MEIVYIVLLFIAPGLIVYSIEEFVTLNSHKRGNKTIYENLFGIAIHSCIVTTISIFLTTNGQNLTISGFLIMLDSFKFIIEYAAIMLTIAFIWSILYVEGISNFLFCARNRIYGDKYGISRKKKDNLTVLQSALFKSRDEQENMFVSMHKGGKLITAGELRDWNQSLEDPTEWKLYHTNTVKRVLKEDESKKKEEKILNKVDFEIYDFDKDLVIKFHNNKKILEHWAEI